MMNKYYLLIMSILTTISAVNICNLSNTFFDDLNNGCYVRNCKNGYDNCVSTMKNYVGVCNSFKMLTTETYDNKDRASSIFFSSCPLNLSTSFQKCDCDDFIFDQEYTKILSCNVSDNNCVRIGYGVVGCTCGNILHYVHDPVISVGQYFYVAIKYVCYCGIIIAIISLMCHFISVCGDCWDSFDCCYCFNGKEYTRL